MRLTDTIINAILGGDIPPGTLLDEVSLSESLGMKPHLWRESLNELCARGLGRPVHDSVIEVVLPDPAVLLNQFEALGELYALCATLAARRAPTDSLPKLEDMVRRFERASTEGYQQIWADIYDRVCHLTKNGELAHLAHGQQRRLMPVIRSLHDTPDRRHRMAEELHALIDAIGERNETLSATIMRGQIRILSREAMFRLPPYRAENEV